MFGEDKVKVFFYDQLLHRPKDFLSDFLMEIGADPSKMPSVEGFFSRVNKGGQAVPARYRIFLNDLYKDEIQHLKLLIDRGNWPEWM